MHIYASCMQAVEEELQKAEAKLNQTVQVSD